MHLKIRSWQNIPSALKWLKTVPYIHTCIFERAITFIKFDVLVEVSLGFFAVNSFKNRDDIHQHVDVSLREVNERGLFLLCGLRSRFFLFHEAILCATERSTYTL